MSEVMLNYGRIALPDNHLTVDDFFIWAGLAMQFEHLLYPFTNPSLLPADRSDADLMLALASIKSDMPDSKPVAHWMLDGRFKCPDLLLINGYWASLT